jgi:hypothetical protein
MPRSATLMTLDDEAVPTTTTTTTSSSIIINHHQSPPQRYDHDPTSCSETYRYRVVDRSVIFRFSVLGTMAIAKLSSVVATEPTTILYASLIKPAFALGLCITDRYFAMCCTRSSTRVSIFGPSLALRATLALAMISMASIVYTRVSLTLLLRMSLYVVMVALSLSLSLSLSLARWCSEPPCMLSVALYRAMLPSLVLVLRIGVMFDDSMTTGWDFPLHKRLLGWKSTLWLRLQIVRFVV